MKYTRIYLLTVFSIAIQFAFAQTTSLSNIRKKNISVTSTSISLDSMSIVPGSFFIPGISPSVYSLDEINAELRFISLPDTNQLTVVYRVLPYRLNAKSQHFNYDSIR